MELNYFHSVVLNPDRCVGCTNCLKVCPTEAIRLKNGKASIIGERCIDCGECIRICPDQAKKAVTDDMNLLKKYKYSIALAPPVLYGQFKSEYTPLKILSALKSLGFDEVSDISEGAEIVDYISKNIIETSKHKPVISSSCPAIMRLIQVRFPELINNVLNITTPVEITARIIKKRAIEKTGLDPEDIGIILITPCTARVTSIKKPLGIDISYIDGTISLKDVYTPLLKALSSGTLPAIETRLPTRKGIICNCSGGQAISFDDVNTLSVDGIQNAISILEEIEIGRLNNLSYVEIMACSGGCLGGPLVAENRHIALNNIKTILYNLKDNEPTAEDVKGYMDLYKSGFISFTQIIEPRAVMKLDTDINKSIEKMNIMQDIIKRLPGINCGICGAPTCQAFAEDVVKGNRTDPVCPVQKISKKLKHSKN